MSNTTRQSYSPSTSARTAFLRRHNRMRMLLFWLVVCITIAWTLLPLLPLPLWSLSGGWRWPDVLPTQWSGRAWSYLFSPAARTLPALVTSVVVAATVTIASLAAGVPAAMVLGQRQFRGRTLVELLIFAPILVPPITVSMGLQVLFIRLGLSDTIVGVTIVHLVFALPYVVLIMASAFAALRPEWAQQARSLGATPMRVFWHVTVPLLRPALAVAALLAFLTSWSQYALTLLIGGGQVWTLPLLVFAAARSSDPALTAAAAVLFIAPTVVFLGVAASNLGERDGGLGIL